MNKGEANGERPQCTPHLPTSHSCDTTHLCVAEKHLQFTQSTRMAVMRQYVSLSGSHGVQDLAYHFQHDFLSAWKSMFEGGGHSLGSAALDILRNAQWMKPTTALNYGQPTVDLAALGGQRTGLSSASLTTPSKATTSSKETKGADAPHGSWRARIAGRWRQGLDHIGFAQYHGAIVKVERGKCPATGLPTCRAIVPWWPQPRDWLDDESNPWHSIDAPQGLRGLYAFEVSGAGAHGSLGANVRNADSARMHRRRSKRRRTARQPGNLRGEARAPTEARQQGDRRQGRKDAKAHLSGKRQRGPLERWLQP